MLAEALSIHVTRAMLSELERLGLPVREVVVNRLLPAQPNCPACAEWTLRQAVAIEDHAGVFKIHLLGASAVPRGGCGERSGC